MNWMNENKSQTYLLDKFYQRVSKTKPYEGLNIIQNIPITFETLEKVKSLKDSGCSLTLSCPTFMEAKAGPLKQLEEWGIPVIKDHTSIQEEYDIILDCAGELAQIPTPRIGIVELTRTGEHKYLKHTPNRPVISVDSSKLKDLEAILGTGDACLRSLEKFIPVNLKDAKIALFGFGKIGQGIFRSLSTKTQKVFIIEKPEKIESISKSSSLELISCLDKSLVEQALYESKIVITATGVKNTVSDLELNPSCLKDKYLVNMGGEDEFGENILSEKKLFDGKPINFFLDSPTELKYLDPVFYGHNLGVDLLLNFKYPSGLSAFPKFIAEEAVIEWQNYHNEYLETVL